MRPETATRPTEQELTTAGKAPMTQTVWVILQTFTFSAMRACTAYLVISSLLFLFNLSLYLNLILLLGLLYVVSSSYY